MEDIVIQQLALQFSMLSADQSMWWMDTGGVMRQISTISTHPEEECLCAYIKRDYGGGYVALDNAEIESFGVVEFFKLVNQDG